jgi:hypothetical protein
MGFQMGRTHVRIIGSILKWNIEMVSIQKVFNGFLVNAGPIHLEEKGLRFGKQEFRNHRVLKSHGRIETDSTQDFSIDGIVKGEGQFAVAALLGKFGKPGFDLFPDSTLIGKAFKAVAYAVDRVAHRCRVQFQTSNGVAATAGPITGFEVMPCPTGQSAESRSKPLETIDDVPV